MNDFYIGFCPSWNALVAQNENLNAETKLILLLIGMFMSPIGNMTWPGKPMLARLANLPEKKVDTALKYAREMGYLKFVRATYTGDSGYEPRVPSNPVTMDLWTPSPKGQSGPVFKIEGKDLLAEVLDATAAHALYECLGELRNKRETIRDAEGTGLTEVEADTEEVAPVIPEAARRSEPKPARRWS